MSTAVRRRLQGVGFLVVVVALIGLSIAKYSGAFADGVPVTLQVDHTGLQLEQRADVKVRGLIVGQVADVSSSGETATVHLLLRPLQAAQIPDNVTARLLPKTLFGEKYVSLVLPARPSGRTLAAGGLITQDRTQTARELEAALEDLLPLLQAVRPDELAGTLGAVSGALDGRGRRLGDTLVASQRLVSGLNTALPELQEDLTRIGDLADTYTRAAPDLAAALADLSTVTRTAAGQRQNLAGLYGSVTRASDDLRGFLSANRGTIITLAADSRPTLASLARYAPEYPCLLGQLAALVPKVNQVMGVGTDQPGLHVVLEVTSSRGKYLPGVDEPRYQEDRGPRCYPVIPGRNFPQYPPDGPLRDGSSVPPPPGSRLPVSIWPISGPSGPPASGPLGPGPLASGPPVPGLPNSPDEQRFIAELLGAASGRPAARIPPWSSYLVGPLLRGAQVSLR